MEKEQERALRKWPNWSAHFAWGALIVLAAERLLPAVCSADLPWHVVGWFGSMAIGVLWELVIWLFSDKDDPSRRACMVDAIVWILGSSGGSLLTIAT